MGNISFCGDCRRINYYDGVCNYCQSENIYDLNKNAPVNVIGTKTKGRVFNVKNQMVNF